MSCCRDSRRTWGAPPELPRASHRRSPRGCEAALGGAGILRSSQAPGGPERRARPSPPRRLRRDLVPGPVEPRRIGRPLRPGKPQTPFPPAAEPSLPRHRRRGRPGRGEQKAAAAAAGAGPGWALGAPAGCGRPRPVPWGRGDPEALSPEVTLEAGPKGGRAAAARWAGERPTLAGGGEET